MEARATCTSFSHLANPFRKMQPEKGESCISAQFAALRHVPISAWWLWQKIEQTLEGIIQLGRSLEYLLLL